MTSSSHFPQSNSLAEKGERIVKCIFKNFDDLGEDVYLGLLNYRSCPLAGGHSPGELLDERKHQMQLPDFLARPRDPVCKKEQNKITGALLFPLWSDDVVRL